jgi:hypothetical protein
MTFTCAKDTYTSLLTPTANYGSSLFNKVGHLADPNTNSFFASFFGFDLSSIPKNKVITAMNIQIYIYSFFDKFGTLGNPIYGDSSYAATYPLVIKARRVVNYTLAELESSLTYTEVTGKPGTDNVYGATSAAGDASYNIIYSRGSYITLPVSNVVRNDAGEYVVAVFRDDNYLNNSGLTIATNITARDNAYPAILTVTLDDYVPAAPTNITPNNSNRNVAGDIKLSWQWEDTYVGTTQASYELMYSTNNFVTSQAVTGTTAKEHIIPANTFAFGNTVSWKVRITDSNGDTSSWSDVATFNIGLTTPSTPEAISPISTIVNSSDEIYYRWKFIDLFGYTQTKFDLQYREGTTPETTITVTDTGNQYIMPSKTIINGGDYSWRVRCYNAFNEVSPYTTWQPFYAIGQPAAPSISSISNNTRPVVKWSAFDQDIYVLKIYKDNVGVYDSGEQFGAFEHAVSTFLEDGNYLVGIKIRSLYGFWSNEALSSFTLSTTKPSKPILYGTSSGLYVSMILTSSTIDNIIYRKGEKDNAFIMVDEITSNTYIDYKVPAGENVYFIRSVNENGFIDSDMITVNVSFYGSVIAGFDNISEMVNLYKTKDTDKRKSISFSKTQYLVNCNGRKYPIQQSMPFRNHSENHEYFIKIDDYDKLCRIIDENDTFYYRNNYGYHYKISLSNVVIQEDVFGYNVSFIVTRLEE